MLLQNTIEFMSPVKIGAGNNALEHLPIDLAASNARKPLILTTKQHNAEGLIKNIVNAFKTSGLVLGVFDAIDDTAGIDTIKKLTDIYIDKGFDSIMAVGGGKVADVAKVLNIVVSGKPEDLKKSEGVNNVAEPLNPFVYIPTSLGFGGEVSGDAVIGDMEFSSQYLMPCMVTIDPRMLKEEKIENVVNLALSSLTKAAEVYADNGSDPFVKSYAHLAINFIMSNIEDVVKRSVTESGWLGKIKNQFSGKKKQIGLANAFISADTVDANAPKGLAQKLGLALSEQCDVKPGIAMGLMLPYVLEYNAYRKGVDSEKIMLPVAGLDVYARTPAGQRFDSAIGKIRHLQNELYDISSTAIPRTIEDMGLKKDALPAIAESLAGEDYDKDACLLILEHAFEGKPVTP